MVELNMRELVHGPGGNFAGGVVAEHKGGTCGEFIAGILTCRKAKPVGLSSKDWENCNE